MENREAVLVLLLLMSASSAAIQPAPDLPGPYCGARAPRFQCCEGRSDSCSVPIRDTLCYCDNFCKTTPSQDCCPDYEEVCGETKKQQEFKEGTNCYYKKQIYEAGQSFRDNCNSCTCTDSGDVCCDQSLCVTDANLLEQLEFMSPLLGWSPKNHSKFWGEKYAKTLTAIANTRRPNADTRRARQFAANLASLKGTRPKVPVMFDARYKWPGLINPIMDQGWCNSAWAFSSVSTANDRIRIQNNGAKVNISVEELIDCSNSRQNGCWEGGHIDRAWNYLRRKGLHSSRHYKRVQEYQCSNSTKKYRRYKTGPLYLTVGVENIQEEIMRSGPVQATMKVHRDFFSYGQGVYRRSKHDDDDRAGYLAVKIIGWGIEHGVNYWIAANSWGSEWGEDGYFRIRRGTNECGIENYVFAAWGSPLPSQPFITDEAVMSSGLQTMKIVAGPSGRRKAN